MRALLLTLVVVAAAGCSPTPSPQAPAEPNSRAGAPSITAPRDASARAAEPCRRLLSPAQLTRLGVGSSGVERVNPVGEPICDWQVDAGGSFSASVVLSEDLFVLTYRKRIFPVFRPFVLEGAPGVDTQPREDSADCTTTIGVADSQSLDLTGFVGVGADGVRQGDPCALNREVAREILSTLPPLR